MTDGQTDGIGKTISRCACARNFIRYFDFSIRFSHCNRHISPCQVIVQLRWSTTFIMRPSSVGGAAYCVALCLYVCLSVCPSVCPSVPFAGVVFVFVYFFTVEPSYKRTSKIEKLLFSLMGQRHVCTFRHAQRAAYRTATSAAQILIYYFVHVKTGRSPC